MRLLVAFTALAACVLAGSFAVGYSTAASPRPANANPVRLEQGVPVSVLDTPSGALAAADNYLAAEDSALASAAQLRRVIDTVWTPADRAAELASPFPAATLAGRPATFAGLRLTAAVAAHKLESYTGQSARVGVWHEITIWSPKLAPTQRWNLDTVALTWTGGRWLVSSRASSPDGHTPVPAWTSGGPGDRTGQAFDGRLAGMSAPYYGSAAR